MKLVIGGAYQGKLDYVRSHYAVDAEDILDGNTCPFLSSIPTTTYKGIRDFHSYIKRYLMEVNNLVEAGNPKLDEGSVKENLIKEMEGFLDSNPNFIIISDEIGCGVVPMSVFDREYREMVGRICSYLAHIAEEVVRVSCGLGRRLK